MEEMVLDMLVAKLRKMAGDDMASVKINSEGRCYLSVGITCDYEPMTVEELVRLLWDLK